MVQLQPLDDRDERFDCISLGKVKESELKQALSSFDEHVRRRARREQRRRTQWQRDHRRMVRRYRFQMWLHSDAGINVIVIGFLIIAAALFVWGTS